MPKLNSPATEDYHRMVQQLEAIARDMPLDEVLFSCRSQFVAGQELLRQVIERLNNRAQGIADLQSIAKTLHSLAVKTNRLTDRLMPELDSHHEDGT